MNAEPLLKLPRVAYLLPHVKKVAEHSLQRKLNITSSFHEPVLQHIIC